MIKDLIKDLAYENITIVQALTRAKIIAYRIKNPIFLEWIKRELNGYSDKNDKKLPPYRIIDCIPYIVVDYGFGIRHTQPIDLGKLNYTLNTWKIIEPVSAISQQMNDVEKGTVNLTINPSVLSTLQELLEDALDGGQIIKGFLQTNKAQFVNVIEQTKQILIDTLMELDEQFPDLENDFQPTNENSEKVQNIITTNIYGDNNPTNIASGANVTQHDFNFNKAVDVEKLKGWGVSEKNINELKEVLSSKDKSSIGGKLLKWASTVTASLATAGLTNNAHEILNYIHQLMN